MINAERTTLVIFRGCLHPLRPVEKSRRSQTHCQPDHHFLRKVTSLPNTTSGFSTIYRPYLLLLMVIYSVSGEQCLVRKQYSHGVFFTKTCPNPISKSDSFFFLHIKEYSLKTRSRNSQSRANFREDTFFRRSSLILPF